MSTQTVSYLDFPTPLSPIINSFKVVNTSSSIFFGWVDLANYSYLWELARFGFNLSLAKSWLSWRRCGYLTFCNGSDKTFSATKQRPVTACLRNKSLILYCYVIHDIHFSTFWIFFSKPFIENVFSTFFFNFLSKSFFQNLFLNLKKFKEYTCFNLSNSFFQPLKKLYIKRCPFATTFYVLFF